MQAKNGTPPGQDAFKRMVMCCLYLCAVKHIMVCCLCLCAAPW